MAQRFMLCCWLLIVHFVTILGVQIWYDHQETGSGFTYSGASGESSVCQVGACVQLCGSGAYTYSPAISTIGYINIQVRYSIRPESLESSDRCRVSYSLDTNSWTTLRDYTSSTNDQWTYNAYDSLGSDANDRSNVYVRWSVVGGSNDCCYLDETYLYGSLPTPAPTTPAPTTKSPTTKAPTTPAPTAPTTATPTTATPTSPSGAPTSSPSTSAPTSSPSTPAPTTATPTTRQPTVSPTTRQPTMPGETLPPTLTPTTSNPTAMPVFITSNATPLPTIGTSSPTTSPTENMYTSATDEDNDDQGMQTADPAWYLNPVILVAICATIIVLALIVSCTCLLCKYMASKAKQQEDAKAIQMSSMSRVNSDDEANPEPGHIPGPGHAMQVLPVPGLQLPGAPDVAEGYEWEQEGANDKDLPSSFSTRTAGSSFYETNHSTNDSTPNPPTANPPILNTPSNAKWAANGAVLRQPSHAKKRSELDDADGLFGDFGHVHAQTASAAMNAAWSANNNQYAANNGNRYHHFPGYANWNQRNAPIANQAHFANQFHGYHNNGAQTAGNGVSQSALKKCTDCGKSNVEGQIYEKQWYCNGCYANYY